MVNLVKHGKFTTDDQVAELWENRNNPSFFTQYAKRAKISVKVVKYGPDNGLFANVRIANGSDRIHAVELSSFRLRSAMWTTGSGTFSANRISQPSLLQRTTAV